MAKMKVGKGSVRRKLSGETLPHRKGGQKITSNKGVSVTTPLQTVARKG